jgi:FkbM family methyltransferase
MIKKFLQIFKSNQMKYFIEIGSNSFDTCIPLAEHGWSGVIVEPISQYLDELPILDNVSYVNAAVSDHDGSGVMKVYNEDFCEKDKDFRGMSTLETEGLAQINAEHIHDEEVDCITYQTLIDTHCSDFPQLDFLKIDTEGHDLKILETIDFHGHLRPKLIKVEHAHCNDVKMRHLLESAGYFTMVDQHDIYAIPFE